MLDTIRGKIKGKKTYLVALTAILGGLLGWANETISTPEMVDLVIQAILGMTIRAGIAKK